MTQATVGFLDENGNWVPVTAATSLPTTGGSGAGAVASVNGQTGEVVLDATDVGALPDDYTPPPAPVQSVNGETGAVVIDAASLGAATDTELAAVAATADSKLESVQAGANVTIDDTDPLNPVISASGGGGGGAVDSVNGQTGAVVLDAADVGALPDTYTPPAAPVSSVNGETGAVVLAASDVGAAATAHTHAAADVTSGTFAAARIPNLEISKTTGLQAELDSKVESIAAGQGINVDATDPNAPVIRALGGLAATGQISMSDAGANVTTVEVEFSQPFVDPPAVICPPVIRSVTAIVIEISDVTNLGFTASYTLLGSASQQGGFATWYAFGELTDSPS